MSSVDTDDLDRDASKWAEWGGDVEAVGSAIGGLMFVRSDFSLSPGSDNLHSAFLAVQERIQEFLAQGAGHFAWVSETLTETSATYLELEAENEQDFIDINEGF
jgi:hypothetical protein